MTEATQRTSDSGVSIWLDDLSRTRIESGSLQELIAEKNVVGVTTNPSIFQKALSQVGPYDAQLKELGKVDVETTYSILQIEHTQCFNKLRRGRGRISFACPCSLSLHPQKKEFAQ